MHGGKGQEQQWVKGDTQLIAEPICVYIRVEKNMGSCFESGGVSRVQTQKKMKIQGLMEDYDLKRLHTGEVKSSWH